ncbi:MAG: hypothetical protein J0I29_15690 [Rhizobiales bacterium]|nr:hypothetical protein [Hyphomicrobiales bacterium]
MSHMASGILGTVAAALALGAVHLEVASGNDPLGPVQRGDASLSSTTPDVNRAVKGDRLASGKSNEGVTISFKLPGAPDSSVALGVPTGEASADKRAPDSANNAPPRRRQQIACELTVSQMTAVAKQLQPGRCLT